MKKKIWGLTLLVSMLAAFAVFIPAANAAVTNGNCADYGDYIGGQWQYKSTATWTFDDVTGALTIGGTGYAKFNTSDSSFPFAMTQVKSLSIADSITGLEDFNSLINVQSFPSLKNVTKIGWQSFTNCGFKRVVLPECITEIDNNCFTGCSNLEYLEFSPNMTRIPYETAMSIPTLKTVKIPDTINKIEFSAFLDCNLTDVFYGGTKAQWNTLIADYNTHYDNPDRSNPLANAVIHCSDGNIGNAPAPKNNLYTVSGGATTFHIPVTIAEAASYKVEVKVTRGGSASENSVTASVAAGGQNVDVDIPLALSIGDIITIRTTKQN
jgi:hypothetical protein